MERSNESAANARGRVAREGAGGRGSREGERTGGVHELHVHAALPAGHREGAVAGELDVVEERAGEAEGAARGDTDVHAAGDRGAADAADEQAAALVAARRALVDDR